MSKGRFIEGMILGIILGIFGANFLLKDDEDNQISNKNTQTEKNNDTKNDDQEEKTEVIVSKTLDAIEKGFDKISKMIDDRKQKAKK